MRLNELNKKLYQYINEELKELTLTDLETAEFGERFGDDRAHLLIGKRDWVKIGSDRWEYQPNNPHAFGIIRSTEEIFKEAQKAGTVKLNGVEYITTQQVSEDIDKIALNADKCMVPLSDILDLMTKDKQYKKSQIKELQKCAEIIAKYSSGYKHFKELNNKLDEADFYPDSMLDDKEGRLTVCIGELYDLEEKAIAEENMSVAQAIKDTRIYADDVRSELYHSNINEANSYTDDMLNNINVANKTINSDLEFNIQVREVNGGVAFNANGTGVQYHPYTPIDHKASKEELADVVNLCGDVIENKMNELEDEIIKIFNERGFRK